MLACETEVLIVGSGPAGSSAALFLSTYGVTNMVVTRYGSLTQTPRAHITNQRTMETLRDVGVADEVLAKATPWDLMGDTVFCTSLAGEELGRLRTWGTHPQRRADYELASPAPMCDMPQHLMEPVLLVNAMARGTTARFDTEYLAHEQDADGITVTVRDRARGDEYAIRAKYLIGADGGRSRVADNLQLPFAGTMGKAGSLNIVIHADLAAQVAHRPSILYWVLQPGADVGGIGMGLVRAVRPWSEWLITWGYDIDAGPPELTEDYVVGVARQLIGDKTVPITLKSASAWTVNHMYAEQYAHGRVFCAGDAVHRHPPSNGLGSNTSIQDAYNLAWKLALVLQGAADPALLETYSLERAPIGQQVVERANQSIADTGQFFEALGLAETTDPEQMRANIAARKHPGSEAAQQRQQLRHAIESKDYEFNAHGIELNQRYQSPAVVADDRSPARHDRDPELYYQPTIEPGARIPHAWLTRDTYRISTIDLGGHGRFTLYTGIGGEGWIEAARRMSDLFGVDIATVVVGPGRDYQDPYGDWARLKAIDDAGCLLTRPDNHICFRHQTTPLDAPRILEQALRQVLGRR